MIEPVIIPDSLLHKKAIARATSWGLSKRPKGCRVSASASQPAGALWNLLWMVCSPGVSIQPMFSPLTRMRSGSREKAVFLVNVASAPFEVL